MPFRSHIKRFLPSFNKTAACEGQQKAVQPSDQHAEVVTQIDVESSASPASNVGQDVPTATSVQSLDLTNLWECAFKEVENKTPDLIESYKQNLVRTARRDGASSSTNSSHPSLENFIKTRLQELQRTRTKLTIAGREVVVRDEVHRMMNTILAASDLIGAAVSSEPHAAVVWAGILFLMNPIANIITQSENAMSGFEEISNILIRYRVMEITPVDISATRHLAGETRPLRELAVSIRSRIIELYTAVLEYQIRLTKYLSRSSFLRLAGDMVVTDDWAEMLQTITNLDKDIQTQWGTLDSQVLRNIESEVLALQQRMTSSMRIFTEVRDESKAIRQEQLLNSLETAKGARFDSFDDQHKPRCLEGTQVDTLQQIQNWLEGTGSESIYWLTGMTGTGKSTISRTVASDCCYRVPLVGRYTLRENIFLGGGFFFDKNQGDRKTTRKLFTTLCACLVEYIPELKTYVSDYVSNHLNIGNESISSQWRNLILGPLSRIDQTNLVNLTLVLVIDALDECDSADDIDTMLQLFSQAQALKTISLRFFITSRPEATIQSSFKRIHNAAFRKQELRKVTLDTTSESSVDDITKFLRYELHKVAQKHDLMRDWPGNGNITKLSEKSDGLFIYAATASRFLGGSRLTRIQRDSRLKNILEGKAKKDSPEGNLDQIYIQILETSVVGDADDEEKEQVCEMFRDIVGTLINLIEPLAMKDFSSLLSLEYSDVTEMLEQLHSVLSYGEDKACLVRLVHLSFRDFLLDDQRCLDQSFWIDGRKSHGNILRRCLEAMSCTLKKDMCSLKRQSALAKDVRACLVENAIPRSTQYASLHWIKHLREARTEPYDDGDLHNFLRTHLLHWLEALSLMGEISHGTDQLLALSEYINSLSAKGREALRLLASDAKRFILSFRALIEETPLQIYVSALAHCPQSSQVRKQFEHEIHEIINRPPIVGKRWDSWQQELQGFSNGNPCLVFSPNGKFLASDYVHLWNPATGTLLNKFPGPCAGTLISFSHDGNEIISLFNDGTIRIWSVNTGKMENEVAVWGPSVTRKTISNGIFSNDQSLVAVGSFHGTIQVLDLGKRRDIFSLKHGDRKVSVLALSLDSSIAASSAKDRSLRIWNMQTQKLQVELGFFGPGAKSKDQGMFSPDGRLFACISYTGVINIWDPENGNLVRHIEGKFLCLGFLPTGQLCVGSENEVRVLIVDSGEIIRTISTSSSGIKFLLDCSWFISWFSPPDAKLQQVRIWDIETGELVNSLHCPLGSITEAALSADKNTLAMRTGDCMIRLWDLSPQPELEADSATSSEGHGAEYDQNSIYRILPCSIRGFGLSFSLDEENQVQLWSAAKGAVQKTLASTDSSSLSRNGRLFVSTLGRKTHQIRDTDNADVVGEFDAAEFWDSMAIFSPDAKLLADGVLDMSLTSQQLHAKSRNGDISALQDKTSHARIWDIATGEIVHQFISESPYGEHFCSVKLAFSSDSKFVAVILQGDMQLQGSGILEIWDATSWKRLRTENFPHGYIHCVALSSGGKYLAYTSTTLGLRLWDLEANTVKVVLSDIVNARLEFAPALEVFGFVGSLPNTMATAIGICDVKSGKLLGTRELGSFQSRDAWLCFSDDGRTVDTPMGRMDTLSFGSNIELREPKALFVDWDWVVCGSEKVFRFPHGTDVCCAAAVRDTLIVSYRSGRLDFLEFKRS